MPGWFRVAIKQVKGCHEVSLGSISGSTVVLVETSSFIWES